MAGKFFDQRRADQAAASGDNDDFFLMHRQPPVGLECVSFLRCSFSRLGYQGRALPAAISVPTVSSAISPSRSAIQLCSNSLRDVPSLRSPFSTRGFLHSPYLLGAEPTIADISMTSYLYYPPEEFGFDIAAQHKNIGAWLDRMKALPRWAHPYDLMPSHPLQH
jgi:hypothetical protein